MNNYIKQIKQFIKELISKSTRLKTWRIKKRPIITFYGYDHSLGTGYSFIRVFPNIEILICHESDYVFYIRIAFLIWELNIKYWENHDD